MKKSDKNYYVVKSYNKLFDGWKTEKQWKKMGFVLKSGAIGILLYTNGNCTNVALYYPFNMVMSVSKCKFYTLAESSEALECLEEIKSQSPVCHYDDGSKSYVFEKEFTTIKQALLKQ